MKTHFSTNPKQSTPAQNSQSSRLSGPNGICTWTCAKTLLLGTILMGQCTGWCANAQTLASAMPNSMTTISYMLFLPVIYPQSTTPVKEPEYVNSFFLLGSDGTLGPLEHKPVGVRGKSSPFMLGGASLNYIIEEEHSPIRVSSGDPLEIVVRLEKQDVEPSTIVLLYPLKVTKGQRQLLITGAKLFGGQTKSDLQTKQQQLHFEKFGQTSLKVTPLTPLAPGEYGIVVQAQGAQNVVYCFGIDAKK